MNPGFTHRETDVNPRYDHLTGYERDNHKKPVTDRCSPQILPAMISIPLTKLPLPRRKNKKLPEYFILYFFFLSIMFVCFVFSALLPFLLNLSLPCSGPVVSLSPHGYNIINVQLGFWRTAQQHVHGGPKSLSAGKSTRK